MGCSFHQGVRTFFYPVFVLLTVVTGCIVFERVSPAGIYRDVLIYGPGIALLWVPVSLCLHRDRPAGMHG